MRTIRLTTAQALVRFLCAQRASVAGREVPLFAGALTATGKTCGVALAEALSSVGESLPIVPLQDVRAMAHSAVGFARASRRRRMMLCVSTGGPGATNLVTAAAAAHVNRLPVLLVPTDGFATRAPDPALQQLEEFGEPGVSSSECLRPVSRFYDRICRPEQLLAALPEAMRVLTDPAECGPATLALAKDAQAEAFDFPEAFFRVRVHSPRRCRPDRQEVAQAAQLVRWASRPLLVAGGGVHYSEAYRQLDAFVRKHQVPVAETYSGRGALAFGHPFGVGAIGVNGSAAANALAREADLVLCVGTRLSELTTASRTLFQNEPLRLVGLNATAFDAHKHGASPLVADAAEGLEELSLGLEDWQAPSHWVTRAGAEAAAWQKVVERVMTPTEGLPSEAQVLGALNGSVRSEDAVVCSAGGPVGEMHKLWRAGAPGACQLEAGNACLSFGLAAAAGVKWARGDLGEVVVLLSDEGYLACGSDLSACIEQHVKLVLLVLDGQCMLPLRPFGADPSGLLQVGSPRKPSAVDLVLHAAAQGALAERIGGISELAAALERARGADKSSVIVIDTDRTRSTSEGGAWWDLPVPEISTSATVQAARVTYVDMKRRQRLA